MLKTAGSHGLSAAPGAAGVDGKLSEGFEGVNKRAKSG